MYVGDFVEAIFKAIEMKKGGIFNLGNPKKYSILDIYKLFQKIMNKNISKAWPHGLKVKFDKNEEGKVFNINQDLSHTKKILGWGAKTSIEEGLRKTIDWYEKK